MYRRGMHLHRLLPFCLFVQLLTAHEGHGKKTAPASAKVLKSPLGAAQAKAELGRPFYESACGSCHGMDGHAKTPAAAQMKAKPVDLTDHRMDSMKDGEIYWVITNGIGKTMPGFKAGLSDVERWQVVVYVRQLRAHGSHHD